MKRIFFCTGLFLVSLRSYSQTSPSGNGNFKVETTQEAAYPGGEQALFNYFYKNLQYSEEAKKKYVRGDVMVSFFVETDSSITNIRVLSEPGFACGDSVKSLLRNMKYVPALQNGVPAKTNVIIGVPMYAH